MFGILLIDKPKGWTSHDAVAKMRGVLRTKKIGHAGTLDPIATGLLVLAVGPATRFLNFLDLEPKVYRTRFQFGAETNTYDAEGEVTHRIDVPADLRERIEAALPSFRGEIEQVPPIFSAIKVKGKELYKYARRGEEVEIQPRTVRIHEYETLDVTETTADFRIVCGGGTYVRSMAHDLGRAVGCGAHMSELVRERIGEFDLEDALEPTEAGADDLIDLAEAMPEEGLVRINDIQASHIREGRTIGCRVPPNRAHVTLIDPQGRVVAAAKPTADGGLQPTIVVPASAYAEPL